MNLIQCLMQLFHCHVQCLAFRNDMSDPMRTYVEFLYPVSHLIVKLYFVNIRIRSVLILNRRNHSICFTAQQHTRIRYSMLLRKVNRLAKRSQNQLLIIIIAIVNRNQLCQAGRP